MLSYLLKSIMIGCDCMLSLVVMGFCSSGLMGFWGLINDLWGIFIDESTSRPAVSLP